MSFSVKARPECGQGLGTMCKAFLIATSLLTFSFAATACDPGTDETTVEARQLQDAELSLEDALDVVSDAAPDAIVLDAEFATGVDAGYYEVVAIDGDDVVTFEVEAEAERSVREVARRRARADRIRRARAHRHARRRLAAAMAERRDRRDGERPFRARLLEREVDLELMNRRGLKRRIRLALQ